MIDQLLEELQKLADSPSSSGATAAAPLPHDVLDLVDQALHALQGAVVPRSSLPRTLQRSVQPHADSLAAVAAAVKGAIWDVSDMVEAYQVSEAWYDNGTICICICVKPVGTGRACHT